MSFPVRSAGGTVDGVECRVSLFADRVLVLATALGKLGTCLSVEADGEAGNAGEAGGEGGLDAARGAADTLRCARQSRIEHPSRAPRVTRHAGTLVCRVLRCPGCQAHERALVQQHSVLCADMESEILRVPKPTQRAF